MKTKIAEVVKNFQRQLGKPFNWALLVIFILVALFLPKGGLVGDLQVWVNWINGIKNLGLAYIYQMPDVNYFPIYLYLMYIFILFFKGAAIVIGNVYLIKILIMVFDFAAIFVVGKLLKKFKLSPFLSFLILFNPAFFYNSVFWGQIESLYVFFIILSLLAAVYHHPNWSVVFALLSLYSKLQAIIFFPIVLLLLLPQFNQNKKLIGEALAVLLITHIVLLFPYIVTGNLGLMYVNVLRSFNLFPILSANAFNFWILIFSGANSATTDTSKFLLLTYKAWGIIMFCLSSLIILLPLVIEVWQRKLNKILTKEFLQNLFLTSSLVSMAFFFFNTEMHERYLQPSIILIGIAFLLKPNKLLLFTYGLMSVAYFLNLDKVLKHFGINIYYTLIYSSRLISVLFTIVLVAGIYELYSKRNIKTDLQFLKTNIAGILHRK